MCKCKDVEMGDYSNQITLGYYPIMREYADNRRRAGLSPYGICVDRCIADQVVELWEAGVRTYGSCCGHNIEDGFINVGEDYEKAIALGFEPYIYNKQPFDLDRKDTVKTKAI